MTRSRVGVVRRVALTSAAIYWLCGTSVSGQVVNGSFETNGGAGTSVLDGWTVVNQAGGGGSWYAQTAGASPINGFTVQAPTQGAFAAMTDMTGPGSHILYQDIAVSSPGTLSFDIYINSYAPIVVPNPATLNYTVTPNQHARVDIMNPTAPVTDVGAGVLQNVFITNTGSPPVRPYTTVQVSLAPWVGQTVRLRFAEVDNQLYFNAGIDNVQISGGQCGNGTLEPGEVCDDGSANGTLASCCTTACQFKAAGSACTSDGEVCTDDVCNAAGACGCARAETKGGAQ